MSLRDYLDEKCIALDLKGDSKEAIIEEMVDLMVAAGKVSDRAAAVEAILERESKMSTGMQNGIAIPHGKSASIGELATAVAIRRKALDFDALDGEPCNIFVMTLSPVDRTGPHIQFLSEISRVLSDEERRGRLAAAESIDAVVAALTD